MGGGQMERNLSVVAIALSILAIVVSLAQPTYNLLVEISRKQGKPSFAIDFYVFETFTLLHIQNNGTDTAHNIQVFLLFTAPQLKQWNAIQYIPEIKENKSKKITIPIGRYQLESAVPEGQSSTNVTDYEADVLIKCNELVSATSFHFKNFIT